VQHPLILALQEGFCCFFILHRNIRCHILKLISREIVSNFRSHQQSCLLSLSAISALFLQHLQILLGVLGFKFRSKTLTSGSFNSYIFNAFLPFQHYEGPRSQMGELNWIVQPCSHFFLVSIFYFFLFFVVLLLLTLNFGLNVSPFLYSAIQRFLLLIVQATGWRYSLQPIGKSLNVEINSSTSLCTCSCSV
jgi:hypothetical protein